MKKVINPVRGYRAKYEVPNSQTSNGVKYNKLIRDKILDIIRENGGKPYSRVLNKKEFINKIKNKIVEEAKELTKARSKKEIINEVVDIQELIDVIVSELGLTKAEIKKQQKEKNKKRGGFQKRLFLIKTLK